jgi:hypothetical protein
MTLFQTEKDDADKLRRRKTPGKPLSLGGKKARKKA